MRKALISLCVCLFMALRVVAAGAQEACIGPLSEREIREIGELVFRNECASKDENLVAWNEGEDFISLGIGHFIWHPAGVQDSFEESFPAFLGYAKAAGAAIPAWLDKTPFPTCPWRSRDGFLRASGDSRLDELKDFLVRTKSLQAAFIVKRLEGALSLALEGAPEGERPRIASQIRRVASTPAGIYALADYVNFKGVGTSISERYQGKGWGLLQVLDGMRDEEEAPDAVAEFARSANAVLEERVRNSPAGRNEQRWLAGWQNRVRTYTSARH